MSDDWRALVDAELVRIWAERRSWDDYGRCWAEMAAGEARRHVEIDSLYAEIERLKALLDERIDLSLAY